MICLYVRQIFFNRVEVKVFSLFAVFHPNIVLLGLAPWEEDSLAHVCIGVAKLLVRQRCGRCAMTTIDGDIFVQRLTDRWQYLIRFEYKRTEDETLRRI